MEEIVDRSKLQEEIISDDAYYYMEKGFKALAQAGAEILRKEGHNVSVVANEMSDVSSEESADMFVSSLQKAEVSFD